MFQELIQSQSAGHLDSHLSAEAESMSSYSRLIASKLPISFPPAISQFGRFDLLYCAFNGEFATMDT